MTYLPTCCYPPDRQEETKTNVSEMSLLRRFVRPLLGRGNFRLPLLRQVSDLIGRHYRPDNVEIEGRRIWLNRDNEMFSRHLAVHGEYEPTETAHVRTLIRPGDTVVLDSDDK